MSVNPEEQIWVSPVAVIGMVVQAAMLLANNTEYSDKINAPDDQLLARQKMGNDYLVQNSVLNPVSLVKTYGLNI